MPRPDIRIDHGGIADMLTSPEVAAAIAARAEIVRAGTAAARTVSQRHASVDVDHYTTDRAAAAVTLTHPGGLGMQAKHGALTRAARAAGLDLAGVSDIAVPRRRKRRRKPAPRRKPSGG